MQSQVMEKVRGKQEVTKRKGGTVWNIVLATQMRIKKKDD